MKTKKIIAKSIELHRKGINHIIIGSKILIQGGFEKHLFINLDKLGIQESDIDFDYKKNVPIKKKYSGAVIKIEGYKESDYKKLAEKLEPDFNAEYNPTVKGLIFLPLEKY